jgi:hypothetical protein
LLIVSPDSRLILLAVRQKLHLSHCSDFRNQLFPLHRDNQSIIRERIYLDKADPNVLHDEITTIDHALTRPWTIVKNYKRTQTGQRVWWREDVCAEGNVHVDIGGQAYFLSSDGLLMPTLKDQPPPDLKYFKKTQN